MARTARSVDLPLELAPDDGTPLPQRIASRLRALIAEGTLGIGQELPSTRALAARLGTSRGTVVAAFEQLTAEGYLESRRGSGTRVSPNLARLPRGREATADGGLRGARLGSAPDAAARAGARARRGAPDAGGGGAVIDLRPGGGAPHALPSPAWRAAWREAAALNGGPAIPGAAGGTGAGARTGTAGGLTATGGPSGARPNPLGEPGLRLALAERLRRVRAVAADPGRLIVTAGARDGLRLVLDALAVHIGEHRPLRIGVESPGYPSLRGAAELLGHRILEIPADEHGLDPSRIPSELDLLLVTPSHQYPIGGSLPVQRRLEILERARADRFVVVEDDHTAEWRWAGAPLPALAGLDDPADPRVALLSSLSSLLFAGMSVGHIHAPPWLGESIARVRAVMACPVSTVEQAALAAYIGGGAIDRRMQRLRAGHRARLLRLRAALDGADGLEVADVPGGLTAVVHTSLPEGEMLRAAAEQGVLVGSLARYWTGRPPRSGIVIGFDGPDSALDRGLEVLVGVAARA